MKFQPMLIAGIFACALPSLVHAQAVQLPTIHVTGVSTTVMVPDRGSTLLGGVSRSSSGSVSRGVPGLSHVPGANRLFGNRAIGSSTSAGTMSVSAHIHDLRAMDEALLAEAAARRGSALTGFASSHPPTADDAKADFMARHLETRTSDRSTVVAGVRAKMPSVDEIREQNTVAVAKQNAEAVSLIEQGQQALQEGKPGVAKIFYNMALRRASGDLQREVQAHLAKLPMDAGKSNSFALGR